MSTTRLFIGTVLVTLLFSDGALATRPRPNIVVILTDDQGWGDLSLNGNKNLQTPHIDSLASGGASFDRFFVCPVCSPTRAEFLTGRYHSRCGVYSTSAGGERMNLDETTIAQSFKEAGYATGAFGKWHNGMQFPYHPNGRGFDEYYGFCSGHWGNYFSPPLEHNGRIVKGEGFVIDDFTNKAMDFIQKHKDTPFFVYLPYNTPHSPMQVPDRWWKKFRDKPLPMHNREPGKEDDLHVRAALAMCENIDWNVGRLLKKLDDLRLADDTVVVFFCDNGPNGVRWNGGMKGRKGSTDEGGVRSPLLIKWPGNIEPGRRVTQICGAIDLLPSLTKLAGIDTAGDKPLDGKNLCPLLLEDQPDWPDRNIYSHWRGRVSVRSQRYRLDHRGALYDMVKDPGQRRDAKQQNPQIASQLQEAAEKWKKDVLPKPGKDDRPFLVGHPDSRFTQLPARDARTFGNIKRSNRFPNCSFFTNWTATSDKITWDAQVEQEGEYEVELYYACGIKDVGATIELSFGGNRLQCKVTQAHDPPLRGGENDRVKRRESYVRDFKSLKMGTVHLKKGRGPLTLRALDIPGSLAIDFRLLMFSRK